jgi:hypothetical protein
MELTATGTISASEGRRPSERVVYAVAAAERCDPTELRPPLQAVVDADALDSLFVDCSSNAVGSVSFEYRDHSVVVESDGTVSIDGA